MSRLANERQRLYAQPDDSPGMVRAMLVGLRSGRDWDAVQSLLQGLQDELELPAPAVSVSVTEGFLVWLSLAEPVSLQVATDFLNGLQRRYLAEVPGQRCKLHPVAAGELPDVPSLDETSGLWSAFIDPGMGSMFRDGTGLDIPPNPDRQADMLAALRPIGRAEFAQALARLLPSGEPASVAEKAVPLRSTAAIGQNFTHPETFLLAVMNDDSVELRDRIRAARALLQARHAIST